MRSAWRVVAILALAVSLVAGCGAESSPAAPTSPPVTPPPVVVETTTGALRAPPTPRPFNPRLPPTFTPSDADPTANDPCRPSVTLRDPPLPECSIKGVVGVDGQKLYYARGDRLYSAVAVDPAHGGRWFRDVAAATAAGFTPSRDTVPWSNVNRGGR